MIGIKEKTEHKQEATSYAEWRQFFSRQRLYWIYFIVLVANPIFVFPDWYLYETQQSSLIIIRIVLELGWLGGLLLLKKEVPFIKPYHHLIFVILFSAMGIIAMTIVLGGFTSTYYHGLNLLFVGVAVILPAWLSVHSMCLIASLIIYYGVNSLHPLSQADINAAVENGVFFLCTGMILLSSVYLYEQLHRKEFFARQAEGKARKDLEVSNQKLRELDRQKSEFFANISHELRTPLTLILGGFKSLLSPSSQPIFQEIIQTGLRNTGRLLFLINELLDLAKFESGRAVLHKHSFDFVALLRSVAAQFESSEKRRIHFRGCNQQVLIEGDARQLKKVLTNLLANAFKFSEASDPQVWLRLSSSETSLMLEVEDNGIGIPPEHLDRIFDRFSQVEGSATRRYEGSGIGLALVKEIVTSHGGKIEVESRLEHGSTFSLSLPRGAPGISDDNAPVEEAEDDLVPPMSDLVESLSLTAHHTMQDVEAPLVLIVEDNPDMQRYLDRILNAHYRTVVAKDGVDGLEKAHAFKPEIILTDMMMPRMSGHDLLKAVRQDDDLRTTPVIFLTARAGTDARIESFEAGADDYIPKPFDSQEVLARLANLLRLRKQEQDLLVLKQEKLRSFLPSHLGEALLNEQVDEFLKPHRTDVTVLFIDLRGYSTFAGRAEPEEVSEVLQEYHDEIAKLISEYEGTIERLIGDAIMAYLNDPKPVPNHTEQGVRLGLAMLRSMERLTQVWEKRGFDLGAGIGLARGFATVGVIGSEGRKEYTATGPVTNLAARLCSEAQVGQLLISEQAMAKVESLVCARAIGPLTLKGFPQGVQAYEVTGLKRKVTKSGEEMPSSIN